MNGGTSIEALRHQQQQLLAQTAQRTPAMNQDNSSIPMYLPQNPEQAVMSPQPLLETEPAVNMRTLAQDIESSLPRTQYNLGVSQVQAQALPPSMVPTQSPTPAMTPAPIPSPAPEEEKPASSSRIPEWSKEPLLLLGIYLLLSWEAVQGQVAQRLPQINADDEGQVSFLGKLSYGVLLVMLFMIGKRLVLKDR